MKVSKTLKISANQFFEQLISILQYELKEYKGKEYSESQITKGIQYKKQITTKLNQKDTVHVKIVEFKIPVEYEVEFRSSQGITTLAYHIENISDNQCIVNYEEKFVGKSTLSHLNYKLVSMFYVKKSEKRAIKMLQNIEDYVLKGE